MQYIIHGIQGWNNPWWLEALQLHCQSGLLDWGPEAHLLREVSAKCGAIAALCYTTS
jgi:hypothetical protein